MKMTRIISLVLTSASLSCLAQESVTENEDKSKASDKDTAIALEEHGQKALLLALEQDDLSADVQDLIDEMTDAEVIGLLQEIELIMADTTDLLEQKNTGGETIAAETEVIEKIFEAAKKKQQNQKQGGG